jgi:hypothetical protein
MSQNGHTPKDNRKTTYYWKTRHALESYLYAYCMMSKEEVATEIENARKDFKLRQHKVLDMKDLWQKVGLSVIRKRRYHAYYCSCPAACPHLDEALCTWHSNCPWLTTITL